MRHEPTLRDIDKADQKVARRLLQCVAVASRPLRVEELVELLRLDFTAGPIPKYQQGWLLEDPVDVVLSTTSSFNCSPLSTPNVRQWYNSLTSR